MADQFSNVADQVSAPATRAIAVTPHDSNALSDIPKALFIGTGGTIAMRGVNDSADRSWVNVPDGTVLPFRARYVRATGTSAADILALYWWARWGFRWGCGRARGRGRGSFSRGRRCPKGRG